MLNLNLNLCVKHLVLLEMRRDVQKEEGSLSGCPQPFCLACPLVSILPFVLGLVVWACPQLTAFSREKGQDCRPLCLLVQLIASSPCWEAGGLCRDLGTRGIVCFIFDLPVGFFLLISSLYCLFCLLVLQTEGIWLWYCERQHSHQRGRDWWSVWWADSVSLWGVWTHKEFDHK